MEVETCRQWREVLQREGGLRDTQGYGGDADTEMRKREDLREKGQKQQRKKGVEREAEREQHVPAVTICYGSILY